MNDKKTQLEYLVSAGGGMARTDIYELNHKLNRIFATSLLHESLSLTGWLGVFLISCGVVVLSLDSWGTGSLKRASLFIALSNAGVIVTYTLVDGVGVRLYGNALSYIGWAFFLPIVPVFAALLMRLRSLTKSYMRHNVTRGLVGGACILGSYGIALWAMTRAPIAKSAFPDSPFL